MSNTQQTEKQEFTVYNDNDLMDKMQILFVESKLTLPVISVSALSLLINGFMIVGLTEDQAKQKIIETIIAMKFYPIEMID